MTASSLLSFSKYHGLGNDFLVADLRASCPTPSPEDQDRDGYHVARALCDRRFGVGGDGVLSVTAPSSASANATMRVLNADGSEAEMCGNGIRCVAKFLLEQDPTKPKSIVIDTGAGPLRCVAQWIDGQIENVSVEMGAPRLLRGEIPMTGPHAKRCLGEALALDTGSFDIWAVSMGNPHAITFRDESGATLRALAESTGPSIENHRTFPNRTNAEFAHLRSRNDIELVVWERGCGITLACGTGACATVVAACLAGHCSPNTDVNVQLLGGPLTIRVEEDYSNVTMSGPARHVFDATVDLAPLTTKRP